MTWLYCYLAIGVGIWIADLKDPDLSIPILVAVTLQIPLWPIRLYWLAQLLITRRKLALLHRNADRGVWRNPELMVHRKEKP